MRVVLDTNVVVSSTLSRNSAPAQLLDRLQQRQFELVASPALLSEYERVLRYPHIQALNGFDESLIAAQMKTLRKLAILVNPDMSIDVVIDDPDDNRILECAVAGAVQLIVSGDRHLRRLGSFDGIPILVPAAFLAVLVAEQDYA